MPRLPHNEILEYECDDLRGWEDMFGIDYPGYLPYWVGYMSLEKRRRYLRLTEGEYQDFTRDMLTDAYDWSKWEEKCPDHAYIDFNMEQNH